MQNKKDATSVFKEEVPPVFPENFSFAQSGQAGSSKM